MAAQFKSRNTSCSCWSPTSRNGFPDVSDLLVSAGLSLRKKAMTGGMLNALIYNMLGLFMNIGMMWCSGTGFFLRNISNTYRSFLGARYMPCQARLVHIVDSAQICNQTLGFWTVAKTSPWYAFVKSLRWSLYALEHQWRFVAGTTEGHILIHRARAFNTHADFYANAVLDLNVDCTEFIIPFNLGPNSIVVISSDGASRDNPGRASASAVVQVCEGSELTVVAYRAVFIGIATSTQAESEAACLAHCLLVDWCIAAGIVQV